MTKQEACYKRSIENHNAGNQIQTMTGKGIEWLATQCPLDNLPNIKEILEDLRFGAGVVLSALYSKHLDQSGVA